MKYLNRSTLGVIIGALNICFFTVLFVYIIAVLCKMFSLSDEERKEYSDLLNTSITLLHITLILCVISLLTSVFLVMGIIKRRHTLMRPWICSAIIGIAFNVLRLIIAISFGSTAGSQDILAVLVIGCFTLGLQLLIFYPIYTLYTDIRDAVNTQEQSGLNISAQAPSYAELGKGREMYN